MGSRLFGIYGPTGAGKTSILDGICFSLFGESSGQERQGDDLRSHHATPDVATEARLIFEVGTKRYHVVRRPRQTVRGKRGDALVERQHWAALYDATDIDVDDIDADNPGVVMEERKVEVVADRMRSILNYSARPISSGRPAAPRAVSSAADGIERQRSACAARAVRCPLSTRALWSD